MTFLERIIWIAALIIGMAMAYSMAWVRGYNFGVDIAQQQDSCEKDNNSAKCVAWIYGDYK